MFPKHWPDLNVPLDSWVDIRSKSSGFVGRNDEIAQIEAVERSIRPQQPATDGTSGDDVSQAPSKITVVTGVSGAGKTALLETLMAQWSTNKPRARWCHKGTSERILFLRRLELDDKKALKDTIVHHHLNRHLTDIEILWGAIRRHWKRMIDLALVLYAELRFFGSQSAPITDDRLLRQLLTEISDTCEDCDHLTIFVDRQHGTEIGLESPIFNALVRHVQQDHHSRTSTCLPIHLIVAGRPDTRTILSALGVNLNDILIVDLGELDRTSARAYLQGEWCKAKSKLLSSLKDAPYQRLRDYLRDQLPDIRRSSTSRIPGQIMNCYDKAAAQNPAIRGKFTQKSAEANTKIMESIDKTFETLESELDYRIDNILDELYSAISECQIDNLRGRAIDEFITKLSNRWRLPYFLQIASYTLNAVTEHLVRELVDVELKSAFEAMIDDYIFESLRSDDFVRTYIDPQALDATFKERTTLRSMNLALGYHRPIDGFAEHWEHTVDAHISEYIKRQCTNIAGELERHNCLHIARRLANAMIVASDILRNVIFEKNLFASSTAKELGWITFSSETRGQLITDTLNQRLFGRLSQSIGELFEHEMTKPYQLLPFLTKSTETVHGNILGRIQTSISLCDANCQALSPTLVRNVSSQIDHIVSTTLRPIGNNDIHYYLDPGLSERLAKALHKVIVKEVSTCMAHALWDMVFHETSYWDYAEQGTLTDVDLSQIIGHIDNGVLADDERILKDGLERHFGSQHELSPDGSEGIGVLANRAYESLDLVRQNFSKYAVNQSDGLTCIVGCLSKMLRDTTVNGLRVPLSTIMNMSVGRTMEDAVTEAGNPNQTATALHNFIQKRLIHHLHDHCDRHLLKHLDFLLEQDTHWRFLFQQYMVETVESAFISLDFEELRSSLGEGLVQFVLGKNDTAQESGATEQNTDYASHSDSDQNDEELFEYANTTSGKVASSRVAKYFREAIGEPLGRTIRPYGVYEITLSSAIENDMLKLSDIAELDNFNSLTARSAKELGVLSREMFSWIVEQQVQEEQLHRRQEGHLSVSETIAHLESAGFLVRHLLIPDVVTFYSTSVEADRSMYCGAHFVMVANHMFDVLGSPRLFQSNEEEREALYEMIKRDPVVSRMQNQIKLLADWHAILELHED